MSDEGPPDLTPVPQDPEVSVALADGGIRKIWAVYSDAGGPSGVPVRSGGLTLGELIQLLIDGRKIIPVWLLTLGILGFLYTQLTPPIYYVDGSVLIVPRAKLSRLNRDVNTTLKFLTTQAEVLSSETVISKVVPTLSFDAGAEPEPKGVIGIWLRGAAASLRASVAQVLPIAPVREAKRRDPVAVISQALAAHPIFDTNIVQLTYVGPNRREAVEVLSKVLVSYQEFVHRMEEEDSRKDFQVLIDREEELRLQLQEMNAKYAQTLAESDVVGPEGDLAVQQQLLTELGRDLVATRAERISLETDLHILDEQGDMSPTQFTSFARERLRASLWRAEVRRAENQTKFDANHPRVRSSAREVEALGAQLERLDELRRSKLKLEFEAIRGTEKRLEAAYEMESRRTREVTAQMITQRGIVDEVERLTEDHRATLEILRDAQLTREGIDTGRVKVAVHVIEEPMMPFEAIWPKKARVLAMCLLIGGVLGLGHTWMKGRPNPFLSLRHAMASESEDPSEPSASAKEDGARVAST